jgi:hypothetical protein
VDPDRLGMVGFCFGGGMTWLVATKAPELKAAVPYYGPIPPLGDVPGIKAAVLALYGGEDQRINAGIPAIEEAMAKNNKLFAKVVYPGAAHAFHNDTGRNYNPEAAVDAWKRTLDWFATHVKGLGTGIRLTSPGFDSQSKHRTMLDVGCEVAPASFVSDLCRKLESGRDPLRSLWGQAPFRFELRELPTPT